MDEGLPIAYMVLEKGVPVYASGGEQVGTVDHVVSAPHEDIFHGIVMRGANHQQFVPADQIQSLHELGVDLAIDADQARNLPSPHGSAPVYRDDEPGAKPSPWKTLMGYLDPGGPNRDKHGWKRED
jgi:sporulation protein YlmC with PRC-barrel domain